MSPPVAELAPMALVLLHAAACGTASLNNNPSIVSAARSAGTVLQIGVSPAWWNAIPHATQQVTVQAGTLVSFAYSASHDVYQIISASAFTACNFAGGTQLGSSVLGGGTVTNNLYEAVATGSGALYIVCSVGDHCSLGQKVRLDVIEACVRV